MEDEITHVAYSDESDYNNPKEFASISIITMPKDIEKEIESSLRKILKGSSVKEFKWNKLRSAKEKFCAEKVINLILENLV